MKFKITSAQINALTEIAADTDEPITLMQGKKDALTVKIGKGKRAIHWLVKPDGYSLPIAPKLNTVEHPDRGEMLSEPQSLKAVEGTAQITHQA